MESNVDVVFVNGTVITVDDSDRVFEAVAAVGNRIARVGTSREIEKLAGPKTRVVDLKGRTLVPGFIDAHCHVGNYGAMKLQVRVGSQEVKTIADVKQKIRERATNTPKGDWIIGRGYDHTKLEDNRHPSRWDLDEAAPDHKVFVLRTCGHVAVANSKTLAEFGIDRDTPDPHGGQIIRDEKGEPTGVLTEMAQTPIKMATQPSSEQLEKGLAMMSEDFVRYGITSAHDASGRNPDEIKLYQKGVVDGSVKVRLYFMVRTSNGTERLGEHYIESGLVTGFGNERLRLGSNKLAPVDGAGGAKTAAMREAYPDDPSNFGVMRYTQEELDELVLTGHKAGYQMGIHAIGDWAMERTLNSYEKALKVYPRANHRHRIEHCGFLDGPMLDKVRDLGLVAAMGVPFMYELGDSYIRAFGQDRLGCVYPLRSLMERGVKAPLSSDAPVVNPNPIHGIYAAVTRKTETGQTVAPEEAVSVMQAIRTYTAFGAYASFEEDIKGSIEPGKLADLVLLSNNILEISPEEILNTTVDLTMIDGEIVFDKQ